MKFTQAFKVNVYSWGKMVSYRIEMHTFSLKKAIIKITVKRDRTK